MGRKTDQRRQLRRRDFISRRALGQLWALALPACLAGRVVDCEALDIRASLPRRRRTVATDQPFGVADLLDRVGEWYDANYGKRMRAPFLAHPFAVDLRGTVWRMRLPEVYGTITAFVDPDLSRINQSISLR